MSGTPGSEPARIPRLPAAVLNVRPGEWLPLICAFSYFFLLLAGYYMLRPVREQFGVSNGAENLQWLYTGTFVTMLLIIPVFGRLSSRVARVPLIAGSYVFFAVNIFLLYAAGEAGVSPVWVGRVFFVWVSVYNLFVVSVFWSLMVDVFRPDQATRLFGMIAAGGSLGAIAGSSLTTTLVTRIGYLNLLPIAGALLLLTLFFVVALARWGRLNGKTGDGAPHPQERALGGGFMDGVTLLLGSRYLLGIAGVMLLYTMTATMLYFEQARLVEAANLDPDRRTQLFAAINTAINVITLFIQFFVTGRLVNRFGLRVVASIMPCVALFGLVALAAAPTLAVIVTVQILTRSGQFSIMKPVQDMLFSIAERDAKYKTKNVVDTAVYRGGDFFTAWLFSTLTRLGAGLASLALLGAAFAACWAVVSARVGGHFDRHSREVVQRGQSF